MVRLEKGVPVEHDLSHLSHAKKVSKSDVITADVKSSEATARKAPISDNTVDEIKAYLDAEGIEYDSKAKKAELLDLAN